MRLGDLLAAPLKTGISRAATPNSSKRCLTLSAVRNGTLDLAANKPADVSDVEAMGNWVLPGAFYVVRGNGNRSLVGRGGFAPQTIEPNVLFPDLLIQVVTDSQVVMPEYLRFVWDSNEVRRDLEGRARTAAGIYKISQGNLVEVKVPLPSVAVQRQVAGLLKGDLARAEEAQTAIGEELMSVAALPAALLRQAFAAEL
jgi:type I restriction enzyme S subunit